MANACGSSESSHVEPPLERSIHTLAITKSGSQKFYDSSSITNPALRARPPLGHRGSSLCRTFVSPLFFVFVFASFQYLTPDRIRIFPRDLTGTPLFRPTALHFICSPARAAIIMSQVAEVERWSLVSIYEPVPVRTVPSDR